LTGGPKQALIAVVHLPTKRNYLIIFVGLLIGVSVAIFTPSLKKKSTVDDQHVDTQTSTDTTTHKLGGYIKEIINSQTFLLGLPDGTTQKVILSQTGEITNLLDSEGGLAPKIGDLITFSKTGEEKNGTIETDLITILPRRQRR
jgi:hypothetical protein